MTSVLLEKADLSNCTTTSDKLTLTAGSFNVISVTAQYNDNTNKSVLELVKWTSSDPSIVEVEYNRIISPKKTGTAILTATYKNKTVEVQVEVTEDNPYEW